MARLALLALCAACDPCAAMARVHFERCNSGDVESCKWLAANDVTPAGTCG